MMIPEPTTKEEIEPWSLRRLCFDLLGQDLVPSDSHDEDGAMMTENQEWYFVPCQDDFVMSQRTLLGEPKPTERLRWRLEYVKCYSGGHMEPDEYDLKEIGERQDSLHAIIEEAAIQNKKAEIRNIGEGLFWAAENLKQQLGYYK